MSFILDALKKSETERQQTAGAEFSSVPVTSGSPPAPRWLWVLGVLLVLNAAILVGLLLRPDSDTAILPQTESGSTVVIPESAPSFAQRVAVARQSRPEVPEPTTTEPPRPALQQAAPKAPPQETVPTLAELKAGGDLDIADLHLDIHVFSNEPEERFVFVNMEKHREGSTLSEGPVVREITHDGVILEHRGSVFLLPRE